MNFLLPLSLLALLATPLSAAEKEPFIEVRNHAEILGHSAGAHVMPGGSLTLVGEADEVIVEAGGHAEINGTVQVLRVGGTAVIKGTVEELFLDDALEIVIEGTVKKLRGQGFALYKEGSVVRGRDVLRDEPHIFE